MEIAFLLERVVSRTPILLLFDMKLNLKPVWTVIDFSYLAQLKCNGPFEEYSECADPCLPSTFCLRPCIPGCVCKKGFTRKNGVCVRSMCQIDIKIH